MLNVKKENNLATNQTKRVDKIIYRTTKKYENVIGIITNLKLDYEKLEEYSKQINKLSIIEFGQGDFQLLYDAKKTSNNIRKKHRKLYKNAQKIISDWRTEKEKIDCNIIEYLKLSSVLFSIFALTGGYLYTWQLLTAFSINPSDYFSLTDYVAASFGQLVKAAIGTTISLLAFTLGRFRRIDFARQPNYVANRKINIEECHFKHIQYITAMLGILMVIIGFFVKNKIIFVFGIPFIAFSFIPRFLKRYIKNPIPVALFLVIYISFMAEVINAANLDTFNIENGIQNNTVTHVYLKKGFTVANKKSLTPIISNSQYYFLLDRKSKKSVIIPKENIDHIETSKPPITVKNNISKLENLLHLKFLLGN